MSGGSSGWALWMRFSSIGALVVGCGGSTRVSTNTIDVPATHDTSLDVPDVSRDNAVADGPTDVGASLDQGPTMADGDVVDASTFVDRSSLDDAPVDRPAPLGDAATGDVSMELTRPSRCETAASDQAPLRDGAGGFRCVSVGASAVPGTAAWPVVAGAVAPISFVRSGASAGGDGSMDRPFADVNAALAAAPDTRTLVLSRGDHPVRLAIVRTSSLTLLGVGPVGGTTLVLSRGHAGVEARGVGVRVELRALAIRYDATPPTERDVALSVQGRAEGVVQDVNIVGAEVGLLAEDSSSLSAQRVSVRSTVQAGVILSRQSRATLTNVLLRDGLGVGLAVESSAVELSNALVAANAQGGIIMSGTPPVLSAPRVTFDRVAVIDNGVVGVDVRDAHQIDARLVTVSGTRPDTIGAGGYGLFIGDGARVTLDADMPTGALAGSRSEVSANARAGVVVDGRSAVASNLAARGSAISLNDGPGVFVQNNAQASAIEGCRVEGNVAIGLGATPNASLGRVIGGVFARTRMGMLATEIAVAPFGDGIAVGGQMVGATIDGNDVSGNQRFATVALNAAGSAIVNNFGNGNGYGIGIYVGGVRQAVEASNRVGAVAAAPDRAPEAATGVRR